MRARHLMLDCTLLLLGVGCSTQAPARAPEPLQQRTVAALRAEQSSEPERDVRPRPLVAPDGSAEAALERAVDDPSAAPAFRQPPVDPRDTRAVVLLYHAFDRGAKPLSVSASNFERQVRWLLDEGVEVVHTSELIAFLNGELRLPRRVAVITIDDGLRSVFEKAWPILRVHSVKFTVGLPTGMLEDPKNAPVMTWDQVRTMVDTGLCEVASHGHMHRNLVGLEGKRLHEELSLSRTLIAERLGREPVAYFYPLGAFDKRSAKEVKRAGYPAAFRASGAPVAVGAGSHFWIPRASVFHDDGAYVGYFFSERFLAQVRAAPERLRNTAKNEAPSSL